MYKFVLCGVLILGLLDFMEGVTLNCYENEKPCTETTCYDPSEQICLNGYTCNIGEELCGGYRKVCYSPLNKTCLTSHYDTGISLICPKDGRLCGREDHEECYSPSIQSCINGRRLCDGPKSALCGTNCYSTLTHTCFRSLIDPDRAFIFKKDEKLCGRFYYSPSTHTCHNNGAMLCEGPKSEVCGPDCFTPAEGTHICDGDTLCKIGERGCNRSVEGKKSTLLRCTL